MSLLLLQRFARRLRPAMVARPFQSLASDIIPSRLADGTVVTAPHPAFSGDEILQKPPRGREVEGRNRLCGPKLASDLLVRSQEDELFHQDPLRETIRHQAQTAPAQDIVCSDPSFELASDILPTKTEEDLVMQSVQGARNIRMDDLKDVVRGPTIASDILKSNVAA